METENSLKILKADVLKEFGKGVLCNEVLTFTLESGVLYKLNNVLPSSLLLHVYKKKNHIRVNGNTTHGVRIIEKPFHDIMYQPPIVKDDMIVIAKVEGRLNDFKFRITVEQLHLHSAAFNKTTFHAIMLRSNVVKIVKMLNGRNVMIQKHASIF